MLLSSKALLSFFAAVVAVIVQILSRRVERAVPVGLQDFELVLPLLPITTSVR